MELLFKNKKAQEEGGGGFSMPVLLAVFVLALIIFVPFIYKEIAFGSDLTDAAACYASIAGSMFSTEETIAKCPIREYKLYKNTVMEIKDGKAKQSDIVKDFSPTDNKVNEFFAKLIGSCLQMGGGVNSRAFSRGWVWASTICLECSTVEFDKDITQNSFSGLRDYLEKNNVPGKDKKYSEFFTRDKAHEDAWIDYGSKNRLIPGKIGNTIDKNNVYTVFFVGVKEGTLKALTINWAVFDRKDDYFVYATAQEDFNKVCDRKVN